MELNWFTIFAQLINFFILIWLLKKFLYAPILRAMRTREQRIENELLESQRKIAEAEKIKEKYEKMLREIEVKRRVTFNQVHEEAELEKEKLIKEIQEEVAAARNKWEKELVKEKELFLRSLKAVVTDNFSKLAKNIFGELASTELDEQLTRVFVRKLNGLEKIEKDKLLESSKKSGGIINVYTNQSLSEENKKLVEKALIDLKIPYEKIVLRENPDIIVGIELKTGDYCISWNVENYLNEFKEEVTKNIIKNK